MQRIRKQYLKLQFFDSLLRVLLPLCKKPKMAAQTGADTGPGFLCIQTDSFVSTCKILIRRLKNNLVPSIHQARLFDKTSF